MIQMSSGGPPLLHIGSERTTRCGRPDLPDAAAPFPPPTTATEGSSHEPLAIGPQPAPGQARSSAAAYGDAARALAALESLIVDALTLADELNETTAGIHLDEALIALGGVGIVPPSERLEPRPPDDSAPRPVAKSSASA